MENKINIAELLKDCPKGMELDCTAYEGIITLDEVTNSESYPIRVNISYDNGKFFATLSKYGQTSGTTFNKCVIFPKGKTTWEGFTPPCCKFKDGDILAYTSLHTTVFIYRNKDNEPKFTTSFYVGYTIGVCYYDFHIYNQSTLIALNDNCDVRLATEEERQKLFQAIEDNGYEWNAETKTLKKLPKFKVGDRVKHISAYASGIVVEVTDKGYHIEYPKAEGFCYISFELEKDYELVPNKFDITTLKRLESKVLVRDNVNQVWTLTFWGEYIVDNPNCSYLTTKGCHKYCIPYEGNEHLLNTSNEPDDFYKIWENNATR